MEDLIIYTDGACSGNPGPGGWAAVFVAKKDQTILKTGEITGGCENTTNNQMELRAAISALEHLTRPCTLTLVTDSTYVKYGMTQWLPKWKDKSGGAGTNWKTSANKPVKNKDLWQRLDKAAQRHRIKWQWIKGHSGHPQNKRADELARQALARYKNK